MARRSKRSVPEQLRSELIKLLTNFEHALQLEDLREKVLSYLRITCCGIWGHRSHPPKQAEPGEIASSFIFASIRMSLLMETN